MEEANLASALAAITSGRGREDEKSSESPSKVGLEKEDGAHSAGRRPPERNDGSAPEKLSTEKDVQPSDPRRDVEPD